MLLYYISGFGFGHLTRSLAVLEALLELKPDLRLVLRCHPGQFGFAGEYLSRHNARVELTPFVSQFQIAFDEANWCIDNALTRQAVLRWVTELPQSAVTELARLPGGIRAVVSDIVPEAFAVAKQAGLPGIGISNYTWYEVAAGFCTISEIEPLRTMYEQADLLLNYELSTGDAIPIRSRIPVGLICRPFNDRRIAEIRNRYKQPERPLVFLSVGGALSLERIGLCGDFDYLYTRGINPPAGIIAHSIPPEAADTHNYLAACDAVITKCGWSTVAEALLAHKPLFVVKSANGWAEEMAILSRLRDWRAATEIDADQLPDMKCQAIVPQQHRFANHVNVVAASILQHSGLG